VHLFARRDNKKRRGRPSTGVGTLIGLRWKDADLTLIDQWRRKQPDLPSRGTAIRRLVEQALRRPAASATVATPDARAARRAHAEQVAGRAIDERLEHSPEPIEEKAKRKRRLTKLPAELARNSQSRRNRR